MSLIDELKRLARPYEDEDDYEEEENNVSSIRQEKIDKPADAEYTSASASPKTTRPSSAAPAASVTAREVPTQPAVPHNVHAPKVVNINTIHQLKVVVMRPECFNDASEIADHLRDKRAVVLNLENTEKSVARRVGDSAILTELENK